MRNKNSKIVLAIVDDHPIVIEGLKTLLGDQGHMHVVSFVTGGAFLSFLKGNEVDIVLLDIMLPDANGTEVCRDIKKAAPETIVLALSNQSERSIILQMLQNGASGYLLKNASAGELIACIDEALGGAVVFSGEVKTIMARPVLNDWRDISSITKREMQILRLLADGKTTAMMAQELHLSPLTVETHRRNLLQKFEVRNVAEMIRVAMQQKLL